jgi:hypothetical protein
VSMVESLSVWKCETINELSHDLKARYFVLYGVSKLLGAEPEPRQSASAGWEYDVGLG